MTDIALHLRIEGRVQGVWYRAWTRDQAAKRGLKGWVRNRSDRSVEALVAGPEALVREMVQLCHKGPIAAKVTAVIETPGDMAEAERYPDFEKRDTV